MLLKQNDNKKAAQRFLLISKNLCEANTSVTVVLAVYVYHNYSSE